MAALWTLGGFKTADMLERVASVPISFVSDNLKLYSAPTAGAKLWCEQENLNYEELGISGVIDLLKRKFSGFKAPPSHDRPIDVQKCETVLCKWHAHQTGHYEIGKDSQEIRGHLCGWGTVAEQLQKHVPKGTI